MNAEAIAYSLEHEPCRFLRDRNISCQLSRRDCFLMGSHASNGGKPFAQFNFSAVKEGVCLDIEVFSCVFTAIFIIFALVNFLCRVKRADHITVPSQPF